MKVSNLDVVLVNQLDKQITTTETDLTPFTARGALINQVLVDIDSKEPGKGNLSTKLRRYDLYKKLKSGSNEFTGEERKMLIDIAVEQLQTLYAGQVVEAIEG
jgi:hypothetical protein